MESDDQLGSTPAHEQNRRAWDSMARKGHRFAKPAKDDDLADPLEKIDTLHWYDGEIRGREVLCLAAGGGRQSALYAAAGARVTVVDISGAMLELDRAVAIERSLDIRTVEASMDRMPMLSAEQFDIVIHPVSTCYVPEVHNVFAEVARVCRPGAIYISQHKTPTSLQADIVASANGYELIEPYYRTGPLPAVVGSRHREEGTLEYLHRWEQLIGGLCRSGFVIEDFIEPLHAKEDASPGQFAHRSQYVAPYVRIKARRVGKQGDAETTSALWTP